MKIYVIAAVHGNEKFGLKVLNYLDFNDKDIRFRVGNLEAIAKNKRYLETDLNRSFRLKKKTKEARLAEIIEKEIRDFMPDYVIDIHTSITPVGKAAIVAQHNKKTELLSQALGMENIIIMQRKYTTHSLIGCLPDRSISIEFGRGQRSDKLAKRVADSIKALKSTKLTLNDSLPLYEVTSTIPKSSEHIEDIENLKFNVSLGAYPFLAGKASYNDIGGFLAKKVT